MVFSQPEGLRNYFFEFGKVDAWGCGQKVADFAFLASEDPASINAVMREHFLDGMAIRTPAHVSIADKVSDPACRHRSTRNARFRARSICVTRGTSSADWHKFDFEFNAGLLFQCTKVVDTSVIMDRETGRSKGFSFVTFEDNSNDAQLVGKLGLILDDKQARFRVFTCLLRNSPTLPATTRFHHTTQQFQQPPSRTHERRHANGQQHALHIDEQPRRRRRRVDDDVPTHDGRHRPFRHRQHGRDEPHGGGRRRWQYAPWDESHRHDGRRRGYGRYGWRGGGHGWRCCCECAAGLGMAIMGMR
jgi:RNA recognition motif-containing protein